jgi:N-acetylglucosamine malate deacetylase 1
MKSRSGSASSTEADDTIMANILAIHAHPDDAEILAGGTLALLAGRGHNITIATLTPGDCGSRELGPEEIAAVRRKEAASAASLIGARYLCLEMRDLAIFNDDSSRRRVVEAIRQVRPHLVLTASPSDYLCDHEAASALVRDACFAAPAPNYRTHTETPAPALDRIPHLYFMDPIGGVDRDGAFVRPDFLADVGETFERKREMLASHASQREWLRQHHGTDNYLDEMERWTRERGQLAGVTHGEGFRLYRGHAYPQSPLLEELLGENAKEVG